MWSNKPAIAGFYQSKRPLCKLWTFEAGLSSEIQGFRFEYVTERNESINIPQSEIIMWGDQKLNVEIVGPGSSITHKLSV
jgi:hypothetical protein